MKYRYFVHYQGHAIDGTLPVYGSCSITTFSNPKSIEVIRQWEDQIKKDNPMLDTCSIDNYIYMGLVEEI